MRAAGVRRIGVLLGVAMAWGSGVSFASHTVFDYAVERVEVDGNVHGPADGTVDLVDEFDDGVLAPLFGALWGTSFETDGALHIASPGFHYEASGQPFTLDQSEVMGSVLLQEGAGNLTARVVWRPAAIGTNHYLHASWFASGGDGIGTIGLALTNFDAELAALFTPPQPPGLLMQAHAVRVHGLFDLETIVLDPQPVAYDSASGAIVMQLDYDDSARTIAVSFSLDGGATFQSPFAAPLPAVGFDGSGAGVGRLIIGADPYDVAPPPPPPTCQFVFQKVAFNRLGAPLGDETVQLTGYGYLNGATMSPSTEGLGLVIVEQGATTAVVDLTGSNVIPPGGPGTGCDPRDGWVAKGTAWGYRNRSGAFPPACVPGSSGGVVSAKVKPGRYAGTTSVQVRLKDVSIGSVTGPIQGVVTRGDGTGPNPSECYAMAEYNSIPCRSTSPTRVKCPL